MRSMTQSTFKSAAVVIAILAVNLYCVYIVITSEPWKKLMHNITIKDIIYKKLSNISFYGRVLKLKNKTKSFLITFVNTPPWLVKKTKSMDFKVCDKFQNCQLSSKRTDIPKSDVLLFHGVDISARPPKRRTGQIWVFLNLESPYHSNSNYRQPGWHRAFNWTMTYRNDSDIIFKYGLLFPSNKEKTKDYNSIMRNKTASVAWVVSHCNTPSRREKYVKILKKYISVDIYGSCGNMKCGPSNFQKCFVELGYRYKFYLAFENSICKDYYTEKVYNGYSSDVNMIPVVRGMSGYDQYFPEGTYIFSGNFSHTRDLAEYLQRMSDEEYLHMLKKKHRYDSTANLNDVIYPKALCKLCEKLNGNEKLKNIDIKHWLWHNTCVNENDVM